MIILGIDPGLGTSGWGVIESIGQRLRYIGCGAIRTNAKEPLAQRLQYLHEQLQTIILTYQPHESALEETFVNKNALSSLKLGHARGVLMLTAAKAGLPVAEYAATTVKKSVVGVGRAEKSQVMMMVKQLLPQATFDSEDAADALAVAVCHAHIGNTHRKWESV
ncbi:MAG: crossover junction endodeoxyribonuclease RuvC [Alphaproteobacteria bacterium]|nr:crossover junction endodeoxyribonuclease RuvC [Alphaproteobacteria bacterium]